MREREREREREKEDDLSIDRSTTECVAIMLAIASMSSSVVFLRSIGSFGGGFRNPKSHPLPLIKSLGGVNINNRFGVRCHNSTPPRFHHPHDDPVVSVDWLHTNLNLPHLNILDASWYMPNLNHQRNPFQEFQVAHIPGSLFFDVDGISDRNTNMPHMLPSEEAFAAAVSALGIHNKDGVVVYDGKGIFSAARVWWMFRVFGHDKVWVLDGGLPRWRASGYDVESSASGDAILKSSAASEAMEKVYQGLSVGPLNFEAKLQPHLLWNLEQIKKNIEEQTHQHVDARGKARFDGTAPEPRKGIRSGHVPGSKCIAFGEVLDSNETLLPSSELAKKFEAAGVSVDRPVVASCGTGVTACILALALHRLGKTDVPIYDGSWTEWGSKSDTPVETA